MIAAEALLPATREGRPTMKLGFLLKSPGTTGGLDMPFILEAERLGYDSAWTGEAYGSDAVTPIAWMLARTTKLKGGTGIMQMAARTPAAAAMTAMTLQALSGGRFLCGIGPSGPQVVEGWHGEAFGKPLARTKEYVSIIRSIFARERPLVHEGEHYQIPYAGPGATGLGKPLKTVMHPSPDLKIYTAAIAPAGLRTAGEVADGTLPFFMSPEKADLIAGPILEGMAKAPEKRSLADFDIAPYVRIRMGDDIAACRDALRPELALYIGGMGARDKNFYSDLARRMGYEAAAGKIQDLFLSGKRQEAAAAVPDALIDEMSLVGPAARIKDRLAAWKELAAGGKVGTMLLSGATVESARVVAEAVL
jgi:F420-dependent oxidoreductase-like protein